MRTGIDCKGRAWEEVVLTKNTKDIRQERFNRLQPLFKVKNLYSKDTGAYWLCQCDCGNQVVSAASGLRKGLIQSCGCFQKDNNRVRFMANLIGERFGKLVVIEFVGSYGVNQTAHWKCQCDCGNTTIVTTAHLRDGHTISCGCAINRTNNQSYGESVIANILDEYKIKYLFNSTYFQDLRTTNNGIGRYDFILFENENPIRIIEFDGIQHFKPYHRNTHPKEQLLYTQANDKIKNEYALEHKIPLVRIPYTQRDQITYEMLMGDQFLITAVE